MQMGLFRISIGLHRKSPRSRGWNREPNNNATSRTGSRFHSRRRKYRSSSKCVRPIQQAHSRYRDAKNRIVISPHQAANSVRIARAAFPSASQSLTPTFVVSKFRIANKEHVDRRLAPITSPIIQLRLSWVDIRKTIDRNLDGLVSYRVPRLEARTARIANEPGLFVPTV